MNLIITKKAGYAYNNTFIYKTGFLFVWAHGFHVNLSARLIFVSIIITDILKGFNMINSRDLSELLPSVAEKARKMIELCKDQDIDILVTSTYRDHASQNALYAHGRTVAGKKVTNAKGGQSFHNWRVAFDVVPLRNGKPVWGTIGDDLLLWKKVGAIGKAVGLEWAGDWKSFKEYPHFQFTGGLSLSDFQAGKAFESMPSRAR